MRIVLMKSICTSYNTIQVKEEVLLYTMSCKARQHDDLRGSIWVSTITDTMTFNRA